MSSEPRSDDPHEPATSIIRRQPTGSFSAVPPPAADAEHTTVVPQPAPAAQGPGTARTPGPAAAICAAVFSILTGWSTAVIATDLIAGWWHTDPLFCVAIGFLTAICAGAGIGGLIALLLHRVTGRVLITVGAGIGLLIFGSLFVAGAKLHPVVYAMPVLPVAAIVAALLPATGRWARS